jgi:serine/threonine-protein kinase
MNPTVEKVLTGIGIGFAVVIIILIIVLLVNLFGNFNSTSRDTEETEIETETETEYETEYDTEIEEGDIEVPVLTNITYEQAKELLEGLGLLISENGTESSDEIAEGKIIRQDIESGTKVSANTTVGVTVSSGSGSVDIVDVVGLTEADALKKLQNAGFTPKKEYKYSDMVAEGTVISQSPESSTKGKEGDTVTITISQGVEMVSVPEVTTPWQAEGTAKEKLAASGLNVKVVTEYSDYVSEGVVMGQDPVSGTKVNKGSEVTLTVSAGPAPVTTYKFSATIKLPSTNEGTEVTSADIVLYDNSGNTLGSWTGQQKSAFGDSGLTIGM